MTPAGRERGVTLVELMIAMMLGLVLTAGMIQVFTGNRATYAFNDGLSRVQENARFALDRITQSARMAGYRGCLADVGVINNLAAPNPLRDDLVAAMQGHEFNGTSTGQVYRRRRDESGAACERGCLDPSVACRAREPRASRAGQRRARDPLRFGRRRAARGSIQQLRCSSPSRRRRPSKLGELLVVTDCQRASIFQLTGIAAAGGNLNLSHVAGAATYPATTPPAWGPNQTYGLASEVARLEAVAFYVGQGESNAPSLFQLRLQRTGATTSAVRARKSSSKASTRCRSVMDSTRTTTGR